MNWSSKMRLIGCLLLVNVMISTSSRWDGILPWYSGSSKYLDNVIIHIKTNNTPSKLFFIILFIIILIYYFTYTSDSLLFKFYLNLHHDLIFQLVTAMVIQRDASSIRNYTRLLVTVVTAWIVELIVMARIANIVGRISISVRKTVIASLVTATKLVNCCILRYPDLDSFFIIY